MGTIPLEATAEQDWRSEAFAVIGDRILSVCPKNRDHNIEQMDELPKSYCPTCGAKYSNYPASD